MNSKSVQFAVFQHWSHFEIGLYKGRVELMIYKFELRYQSYRQLMRTTLMENTVVQKALWNENLGYSEWIVLIVMILRTYLYVCSVSA